MATVQGRVTAMAESARASALRLAEPLLRVFVSPSPWFRKTTTRILWGAAAVGLVIGVYGTLIHLRTDPLGDVRAYYDAGARLNAGQPLYPATADTNLADFYRYPPLIAIIFRPLAQIPYEVAAPLWGLAMVGAFLLTVRRIGTGTTARLALAFLSLQIGWSLAIGQAQSLVTLLVALGSPWSVALAANIKVFPILIALYWLGRRDWRALALLAGWSLALVAVQFVLEPAGTIAYLGFLSPEQVGEVYNLSPYAFSPILWGVLAVAGAIAVLLLARTRFGWAAAVVYSTVVTPRLLVYQFMTLVAAVRSPDERGAMKVERHSITDTPAAAGS